MIDVICKAEPEHVHSYPDDYILGGTTGTHPGADARNQPVVYQYYDEAARPLWATVVPICDDQAIDYFTMVASFGPYFNPVWVSARSQDRTLRMLPFVYEKATDTAWEKKDE